MTPQEEQFLQTIKAQVINMPTIQKQKLFLETQEIQILNILLDAGVDINYKYYRQVDKGAEYEVFSALIEACRENYTQKALWLIKHGADLNSPLILDHGCSSEIGTFALLEAIWNNNTSLVSALVASGADVGVKYSNGKTALTLAQDKNNKGIIKLLKSAGAKE